MLLHSTEEKKMRRVVIGTGILVAILLLAAGCVQQAQVQEVKVGVVASLTGPVSNLGNDMWRSAQMAADEINTQGGVYIKESNTRVPLRLIAGDDESTREGGMKAVTKLIMEDRVNVLVGGYSSAVTSAHQTIVAENKIPYIITGASSPIITHRTDINTSYFFHHCPTTDTYGDYTVRFVDQVVRPAINTKFDLPAERPLRLAFLYQDSPYGKGVLDAAKATIARDNLNIEIVGEESFAMGETDFRTALIKLKAASPDVIYPAAFPNEQSQMVPQARRDVGLNAIFLAVETNDAPEYYKGVGQFGEFSVIESRFSPYTVPAGPIAQNATAFKETYKAKWGDYPGMMGASTYEGVYIAARAIEQAGTTNATAIRDALATLNTPQIIEAMEGGTISFTPDFRESQFSLYMVELFWNDQAGETRPKIVWPDNLKETDFVLPDWYTPA
jgi:branched-chain amino acid transport system substrate-binding protein